MSKKFYCVIVFKKKVCITREPRPCTRHVPPMIFAPQPDKKKSREVLLGVEPRLEESEPSVMATYCEEKEGRKVRK